MIPLALRRRGRSSGAAPSLPPVTSGLFFWLEADTITAANNDPVSTWADQSGGARDFTSSGTSRPLYKTGGPNGKPYVSADGSNDHMATASIAGWGDVTWTIFIVAKANAANASKYLYIPGTANKLSVIAGFEANMIECYADVPGVRCNIGTFDTTDWAVYEFTDLGNNAASSATGYKNGTSTESVTGSSFRTIAAGVHYLFASGAASNNAAFDIAAFGLFAPATALTAGERSSVRSYLGTKYGITVS